MKNKILSLLSAFALGVAVAALACVPLAVVSCATDTGNAAKDARGRATNAALSEAGKILGQVAVATLFNVTQQEATGGKIDFGSAASSALWANAGSVISSDSIANIVNAYSGKNLPKTAQAAAVAFAGSSSPPAAKTDALAAVISSAVGAPPKL